MFKLLSLNLLLVSVFLSSCNVDANPGNAYSEFSMTVKVIKIDSCEYILADKVETVSIIHKQNCVYCTERNSNK